MSEIQRGDRTSICELLGILALIADSARLREQWQSGAQHSSYAAILPTIFDDLRIRDRALMSNGYWGTYQGFSADLAAFADALDRFDDWWCQREERKVDLEILSSYRWVAVIERARDIVLKAHEWQQTNCTGAE